MLTTIKALFSKQEVAIFRQHLDTARWQDGRNTAGSQASLVKNNTQLDPQAELSTKLSQEILRRLGHNPVFMAAALADKIYPPKFNCYENGGHYGLHVDSSVMPMPNTSELLRSDLSATVFLSEPNEYKGGVLSIETDFGAQEVKLEAGDMVLYPSSSLHQVTAVTEGKRISAFFWIQSMVRDNTQRTMLFDLDQSIQSLSHKLGTDDEEVLRLSQLYHNLLRQWAL